MSDCGNSYSKLILDPNSYRGDGLTVWVNVRLPGVHQVGDSGGSGSGVYPVP